MTADYLPIQPYLLQSGKKEGKSVEQLMFDDYSWVTYMQKILTDKSGASKNEFHKHVLWAIARGETRKPKMLCPQCNEQPVTFFSILGSERFGYSMSSAYTCCREQTCIDRLSAQGIEKRPMFFPIKFSSISRFDRKGDQKQVVKILKKCYGLPARLTKEILFAFFCE